MPMRIVYKTGHGVSRVGHSTNQRLFTFQQHSSYHQIVKNLPDKEGKEEPGNRNNTCLHFLSISHPPTRSNIVYNNKPPRKAPDTQDTGQKGVTKKRQGAMRGCEGRLLLETASFPRRGQEDGRYYNALPHCSPQSSPPSHRGHPDGLLFFLPPSFPQEIFDAVRHHTSKTTPTHPTPHFCSPRTTESLPTRSRNSSDGRVHQTHWSFRLGFPPFSRHASPGARACTRSRPGWCR